MYRKQRGRAAGAQQEGRLDDAARGHRDADRRLARPRQQECRRREAEEEYNLKEVVVPVALLER